jgi:hypothetical protein
MFDNHSFCARSQSGTRCRCSQHIMQNNMSNRSPFPSRRQFLAGCSALALTTAAVPASILRAPLTRPANGLDSIGFSHFATQVGTNFGVWQGSARAGDMILIEARPSSVDAPGALQAPDAFNEKFSLIFEGSTEAPLSQNTYLFEHAALGRFLMFIVPIFPPRSPRAYYQAIFNRPFQVRNRRG